LHQSVLNDPPHKIDKNTINSWLEKTCTHSSQEEEFECLKYAIENICSCEGKCKYYDLESPNAPYQCPTYFSDKDLKKKLSKNMKAHLSNIIKTCDYYGPYTSEKRSPVIHQYINSLLY